MAAFKIREIYERKAATNKANAKAKARGGRGANVSSNMREGVANDFTNVQF